MPVSPDSHTLRAIPLFSPLDGAALGELAGAMAVRHLQRGELLALEGDPCTAVYFVVQGRLRAYKVSAEGREQVVAALGPGEAVYLVPALDGGALPASTLADTRCELLAIDRAAWAALVGRHPALLLVVAQSMAAQMRRLTLLVEDLALRPVSQRLARLLLLQLEAAAPQHLTQQAMAAQVGTVREVVSRTLASFAERGWIDLQRGRIAIRDLAALRREAGHPM